VGHVTDSSRALGDIALILIDIDGTLVGTNAVIAQSTWLALAEARRRGVHLALCTGRPCSGDAVTYAREVSPHEPHIFQSGAVVAHPDGRVVQVTEFPMESYKAQVDMARTSGLAFEVYTAQECFVERHTSLTRGHADAIGLSTVVVPDLLSIDGPVVRVQWIVPWDIWPPYEAAIKADQLLEVSVARHPDLPQACFTSVTAHGISKASAARTLARHYGLDLTQTAMIGDGDNDIGVLGVVGLPIAMRNATEAVKAVAAHIVGDVDEDGFAEAIAYALRPAADWRKNSGGSGCGA
jgi:Cof subfamily protein (haloacid dehalogenase superfamily)